LKEAEKKRSAIYPEREENFTVGVGLERALLGRGGEGC